jgi:hypothetical protein
MKIDFSTHTFHGDPKAKSLFMFFPIEDAEEPFCWNAPFFIRAKNEKDAIKEAYKLLNDGTFSGITKSSIEENNEFWLLGTIED